MLYLSRILVVSYKYQPLCILQTVSVQSSLKTLFILAVLLVQGFHCSSTAVATAIRLSIAKTFISYRSYNIVMDDGMGKSFIKFYANFTCEPI